MAKCRWMLLAVAVLFGAAPVAVVAADARYLAVFADGSRKEGNAITGWDGASSPSLDGANLADPAHPLRWLRDRAQDITSPSIALGRIEFADGDCLFGRVTDLDRSSSEESSPGQSYLRVETRWAANSPAAAPRYEVRVRPQFVRRIVWGREPVRRGDPGTVVLHDGRRLSFRALRWQSNSLQLLEDGKIHEIPFDHIVELCCRQDDPWQAYYEQLATLSPDGTSRLVRLESTRGLVATTSELRFRAASHGAAQKPGSNWYHVVQPIWSLDPIWVPFDTIRTRWSFAPHEVPLSWRCPHRVVEKAILGQGWPWMADRNVQGGDLGSGDLEFGWGLGVQASGELWFELPETAQAFRTRAGLDRIAGTGGCVQARVYLDRPEGGPCFQSKTLVGSAETVDSGAIALAPPAGGRKSLILVADALPADAPPDADPLDIRDRLDWLEPLLLLDPARLRKQIEANLTRAVSAWEGWEARVEGDQPIKLETRWDREAQPEPAWALGVSTSGRPLTLSGRRQVRDDDRWLLIRVQQALAGVPPGNLEIRIDELAVIRGDLSPGSQPDTWAVPLDPWQGQTVKIEILHRPGNDRQRMEWLALEMVKEPP